MMFTVYAGSHNHTTALIPAPFPLPRPVADKGEIVISLFSLRRRIKFYSKFLIILFGSSTAILYIAPKQHQVQVSENRTSLKHGS